MKHLLIKLAALQAVIGVFLVFIALITPLRTQWDSLAVGSGVALLSTCSMWFVFWCLPEVMSAKQLYKTFWGCEIIKWGTMITALVVFMPHHAALAVAVGFSITYVSSYILMILME